MSFFVNFNTRIKSTGFVVVVVLVLVLEKILILEDEYEYEKYQLGSPERAHI